jgi:signal-transduction protein with cAMP-binding, CBS, and nucleotidyltransferase domain
MDKFLGMRLRHLLIEKNGQYIGMLSSGDVMKETLREKTREYESLNFEVSWDYYENWRTPVTKNTPEVNEIYMPYPANLQARRSR